MNLLLNGLRSRLLRPVLLSLVIIGVVQVVITLMVTQSSVSSLVEDVVDTLKQGNDQLASGLQQSGTEIGQTMEQLSSNVGSALGQTLTTQLAAEQANVSKELVDSIHLSAQAVAEIMALVSPDAIWDRDTPTLTRFVRDLQRNPQVVFSAYIDMDGKPLTRFLDRSNDKVKELLSKGEGRRSLDKVIDAARKDNHIYLVEIDINPKGVAIGKFLMAVTEHEAYAAAQALEQRFSDLIKASRDQVQQSINAESQLAQQGLQQSLQQASELNRQTGEQTREVIGSAATKLVSKISLILAALGALLVIALMVILAVRVVAKVRNLTLALDDLAEGEGDLTQRIAIDSQDEIADMATAINLFIEKTQRLVQQANSAADQTAARVADTHRLTDQANRAVDSQHQQLGQASSAMAEMVSSIHQVAERIQQNLANVDTIRQASTSASTISSQVRSDIETLVQQVRQASEVVNGVADQSQQIEVVLEVIKSIAEQTNLLALNAAIEAARAGESGRGFAVVADEVRALAGKTQQSTEDIQKRIDGLQHEVGQAVSVIERVCVSAEAGIEHIGHSDEQMQQVSGSVDQLYDLTNDIAAMAEEQSQVSADINSSVGQISEDAELAASSMQQNIEATDALDELARSLKQTLRQFKV